MFYIHRTSCISPQKTFTDIDIETLIEPDNKILNAVEPAYSSIPPGVLRRMGRAVRMGVGAAIPLLEQPTDGIIIGTTNAGKEDCVKFLNQIVDYDEGLLTPLNFVQSTPNAVAAQIGLLTKNTGYNISHLHLGLSFEYAITDADMLLSENSFASYLLGAVDDISVSNYNFEDKGGWYKHGQFNGLDLYNNDTSGSIAGEGSAMFIVNAQITKALGKLVAIDTLHSENESMVKEKLNRFVEMYLPSSETIDLFLSGENGDNRLLKYYTNCEAILPDDITIARYKHMCGEYPTASAFALWTSVEILRTQSIPQHMIKRSGAFRGYKNVLIYNNYKGIQHSFMLVSLP